MVIVARVGDYKMSSTKRENGMIYLPTATVIGFESGATFLQVFKTVGEQLCCEMFQSVRVAFAFGPLH